MARTPEPPGAASVPPRSRRGAPSRVWTGVLAGVMAFIAGIYIAEYQIVVDSFAQLLMISGLLLVSGGHLGSVIVPALRATKAGATAALGTGKGEDEP